MFNIPLATTCQTGFQIKTKRHWSPLRRLNRNKSLQSIQRLALGQLKMANWIKLVGPNIGAATYPTTGQFSFDLNYWPVHTIYLWGIPILGHSEIQRDARSGPSVLMATQGLSEFA